MPSPISLPLQIVVRLSNSSNLKVLKNQNEKFREKLDTVETILGEYTKEEDDVRYIHKRFY